MICHQENMKKNLDAILHLFPTQLNRTLSLSLTYMPCICTYNMHYMLHNYSIVTCRTFVIYEWVSERERGNKKKWKRHRRIKMIKVAEYVKKEVKYKEEKMATTRHETIEYKKFHSLSLVAFHHQLLMIFINYKCCWWERTLLLLINVV